MPGSDQLSTQARLESPLAAAQFATVSKAVVELPRLRYFGKGLAPEAVPEDQIYTEVFRTQKQDPGWVL